MRTMDFSRWANRLIEAEATKSRTKLPVARTVVAQRLGVLPGTLESLHRGRIKRISDHLANSLRGAICNELTAEITRLEHELLLARAGNTYASDDQIQAAAAALEQAKRILRAKP